MPDTKITDVEMPLAWEEAAPLQEVVRAKAARQFLSLWRAHRSREDSELRWGEEIEYFLVHLDGTTAKVALCADEVLRRLGSETGKGDDPATSAGWRTEYGNMMVEGVTHPPYRWSLEDILLIEPSLSWRRRELQRMATEVDPSVHVVTMTAFPLLGVHACTQPHFDPSPDGAVSRSILCPDEATSPHPRYKTFTANYRKRKGCTVGAFIPREGIAEEQRLSPEELARVPFRLAAAGNTERDPVPGHIYMDSQAFGACQCCTQATFLVRNLEDAKYLTDQFLILAPLFLALTAATPFLRGLVAETDTRWPTFQQCWDDRHDSEVNSVRNSRTSANDLFIGDTMGAFNNVEVPVDAATARLLEDAGVDAPLSRHVAHVLARDALMVFSDRIETDDAMVTEDWEQLQGTNWGTVRFKPPPSLEPDAIGWRVEFRSPEVQLTDFENAAVVAVVRVLAEVIIEERWDLALPISRCDANDVASGARDAAKGGRFWFRSAVLGGAAESLRPLADIFSAEGGVFTRCRAWLDRRLHEGRCSQEAAAKLRSYMFLFERRATGELPTPAAYLRARLQRYPGYARDGVLPPAFVRELCQHAAEVNLPDAAWPEELLGPISP